MHEKMKSLVTLHYLLGAIIASHCVVVAVSETAASYSFSPSQLPYRNSNNKEHDSHHSRVGGGDSIQHFLQDLDKLKALDGQITLLTPTHSKHDSSFTRNWNLDDWDRHQVRSFSRYRRHLQSWPTSPTALAVLPTVSVLLLWTLTVFLLSTTFPPVAELLAKATFPTASFAAPISLLLALRTNRALNRLLEARSMFGKMIRVTASMTGLAVNYFKGNDEHDERKDQDDALLFGRYLSIYGWAVKGHFRGAEDASQIVQIMLPPEEVQWIQQSPADLPTSIIFRLRQLLASKVKTLPLAAAQSMEQCLCELEITLGVCKRLVASPIPPTYTRHTSRVLCLFLGMLPVAMTSSSSSSLLSTLVSMTLISYVFVGIDEIGVEIEHPFPLLPMYHMAKVVQQNVRNQCLMGMSAAQAVPNSTSTMSSSSTHRGGAAATIPPKVVKH